MKSLVKKIVAILTVTALIGSLGACKSGSGKDPDTTGTPAVTATPTDTVTSAPTSEPVKDTPTTEPTAEPVTPEPTDEPAVPTQDPVLSAVPENIVISTREGFDSDWNTEQNKSNGYYSYDYPVLDEKCAEKYPKLAEAFEQYRIEKEDNTESVLEDIRMAAVSDEVYGEYFAKNDLTIIRADSNIVCVRYDYYYYTGGLHGSSGTYSYCWDPVSGERIIGLADIVTDKEKLIFCVYDYLMSKYDEDDFFVDDLKEYMRIGFDDGGLAYEIGYNYLSIIFNAGDITAHYIGKVNVDIPFKGNETMFNPKYLAAPDNYMVYIGDYYNFRTDLLNDGEVDTLDFYTDYVNEYEEFDGFTCYLNEIPVSKTFGFDYSAYELDPYYIHANGKDYLYMTIWFDSEDTETYAYRIDMFENGYDDNAPDNPWGDIVEIDHGNLWDFAGDASYDPMDMVMSCRHDMIGTNFIKGRFCVGYDGLPELLDKDYTFTVGYELTVIKPLTLMEVTFETGEGLGMVDISENEVLSMYRTDGATFVDLLRNVDGHDTLVRLDMEEERLYFDDGEDYYSTYNIRGIDDPNEVFSGIGYAD